jgi:putative glutamine amidotransferase
MMPKYSPAHTVEVSKKSMLYELLNKESLAVNSYHHQAINKLGENLEIMGKAKDGIIESFEHRAYPFLLAVQWHPEMMAQHSIEQLKIFELLVKASN